MSSIRIIELPPGFAPKEIRAQWVGVVLPIASDDEISKDLPTAFGIGSGNSDGYFVFRDEAIKALRTAGKEKAVRYWSAFPLGKFLKFKKDVCAIVE